MQTTFNVERIVLFIVSLCYYKRRGLAKGVGSKVQPDWSLQFSRPVQCWEYSTVELHKITILLAKSAL